MAWAGEICKLCRRRNVVGFRVADDVWQAVAPAGKNVLCPTCFDELAEAAGVPYAFLDVFPVPWSAWESRRMLEA
jgi:hypothetical protein